MLPKCGKSLEKWGTGFTAPESTISGERKMQRIFLSGKASKGNAINTTARNGPMRGGVTSSGFS
jgi:hypothetical protein